MMMMMMVVVVVVVMMMMMMMMMMIIIIIIIDFNILAEIRYWTNSLRRSYLLSTGNNLLLVYILCLPFFSFNGIQRNEAKKQF